MMPPSLRGTGGSSQAPCFATTHWSVVLAASHQASQPAAEALDTLCRTYWYPLYAYARRRGCTPEDAQDVVQEFFARFLARDYVARADPDKGKFRSFLLAGLKHLLCNEWAKARCLKRGGGQPPLSLDAQAAEDRFRLEPADQRTPEHLYERSWAMTLLERAASRLRDEYAAAGKIELFEQLTEFRLDAAEPRSYAEVAGRLSLSEGAVKSAIHRLRQRHLELVREEISHTLADPSELQDEVRYLLGVLGD